MPIPGAATAFRDLDTGDLDHPGTVLGLLADHPITQMLHGAIIGTDSGLSDFVAAGRPWWMQLALRYLSTKAGFSDPIEQAEKAYSQIVMNELETGRPLCGREAALAEAYRTGCRITGVGGSLIELPPQAHDFVIPSVSQALGPLNGEESDARDYFLGNSVNPKGTHISGGDESDPDSDKTLVMSMLELMGRRLA